MEYRAVVHRAREVRRDAAARGEHQVERLDASLAVEAGCVLVKEIVALAGADHVVVAVGAELHRPAGCAGEERCNHRVDRGLRLLAAEATAEPPQLHGDLGIGHTERSGDEVLHLGRMLRRRMHEHRAALAGNSERHLAFQVEVLLPAAAQLSFDPVFCGDAWVAAYDGEGWHYELASFKGLVDGNDRLAQIVFGARAPRCAARSLHAGRRDGEERLAAELDPIDGEYRLVRQHRPDVVASRDIGRADHCHNPGRAPHRLEVEGDELRECLGRDSDRRVQRPGRLGQVVDVACLARDVQGRAVVR
jgi:hypothetical protein